MRPMYLHAVQQDDRYDREFRFPSADLLADDGPGSSVVPMELGWRQPQGQADAGLGASISASRWIGNHASSGKQIAASPADRHVLGLSLKPTCVEMCRDERTIFNGVMPAGTLQITGPGKTLSARFRAPCDFLHLYVPSAHVRRVSSHLTRTVQADLGGDDHFARDPLLAQLAQMLTAGAGSGNASYAQAIVQTIIVHLFGLQRAAPTSWPLPKWRLRRVHDYIEAHIGESVSLADMAAVAGLSRMHFAAQFRAATGYRPHEYVLAKRVDRAKLMLLEGRSSLVEIALSVGFQAQAHFTTVFKKFEGDTPARWRRANAL